MIRQDIRHAKTMCHGMISTRTDLLRNDEMEVDVYSLGVSPDGM